MTQVGWGVVHFWCFCGHTRTVTTVWVCIAAWVCCMVAVDTKHKRQAARSTLVQEQQWQWSPQHGWSRIRPHNKVVARLPLFVIATSEMWLPIFTYLRPNAISFCNVEFESSPANCGTWNKCWRISFSSYEFLQTSKPNRGSYGRRKSWNLGRLYIVIGNTIVWRL